MGPELFILLKTNLLIAIFTLIYTAFLRKETYFHLNRFFLLSGIFLAFLIPFINIPNSTGYSPDFTINEFNIPDFLNESFHSGNFPFTTEKQFLSADIIFGIYITGVLFFGLRFIFFLTNIIKLAKRGSSTKNKNILFIITKAPIQPFSFFNIIFLNLNYFKNENLPTILKHEQIHIKQGHSFDLILIELLAIVFWVNPFIYLLRKAVRTNHEFLADASLIRSGTDKLQYMKILANHASSQAFNHFGNHFKNTSLKKRILMISRRKTRKWHQLKYILLAPVIFILVYTFGVHENKPVFIEKTATAMLHEKTTEFISPFIDGKLATLSSGYGNRLHPLSKEIKFHFGIDFSAPNNTPVVAVARGKIRSLFYKPESYGKYIIIDHDNGFSSLYAQLSGFAVKEGEIIKQGETIGFVGSSGMSTGPHLHIELKKDGEYVNPGNYLQ